MSLLVTDNGDGTWTISCGGAVITVGKAPPFPLQSSAVPTPIVAGGGGVVIKLQDPDIRQVEFDLDRELSELLQDVGPSDTRNLVLLVKSKDARQFDLGAFFTQLRSKHPTTNPSVYLSDDE